MDIRFNHLESLHWLWLVAALAVLVVVGFAFKRRALTRFAELPLLERLAPSMSLGRQYTRAVLVLVALVMLVAALIDPRWGVTYQQVFQRGIDMIVVLDVSRSMLAEDAKPNRLERAKQYINDLVREVAGDRIALITFAGSAGVTCPLTVDTGAFRLALDTVTTSSAPRGGSLLGDALRLAAASFPDDVPDHKAIIVFSDGEDHGSYPIEAAQKIREERSVPIYTVAIGDPGDGARIPVTRDGRRQYLTYDGEEVWSRMDARTLRAIALESGGAYIPVGTGTVDMGEVYAERIRPMARREFERTERKRHQVRYQWFAAGALGVLLLEMLISDQRRVRRPRGGEERLA